MDLAKLLTILLCLALVLPIAQAQQDTILLFPLSERQDIDACTSASYDFEITNAGTFADTFLLSTSPLEDSTQLNESVIFLLPGEFKVVRVSIFPPCGLYGSQKLVFHAESAITGASANQEFTLNIKPTNIPLIADGIDRIRVTFDRSGALIPISNLGDVDTTYQMELEGESWMRFSKNTLLVPKHATETIQLITEPDNRTVKEGEYPATIVARVDATGIEYVKEIVFVLKNPTWVDTAKEFWWALVLGVIGLILLLLISGKVKQHLDDTREEREARKEERRRERERDAREKEKAREVAAKEKEKAKAQKEKERVARIEEKAKLSAQKEDEKAKAKHQSLLEKVVRIFLKELRQEYKYKPLEGEGSRRYIVAVILLIAVALCWFVRDQLIAHYAAVGAGILAAIVVLVFLTFLFKARNNRLKDMLSDKELASCRDTAIRQLRERYELIRWSDLAQFERKASWKKIALIALIILLLIAGAVFAYMKQDLFEAWAWMAFAGVCAVLVVLIVVGLLLRARLQKKRIIEREYGEIQANKYEKIETNEVWGLLECSFKLKHKVESALLRVNSNAKNIAPVAPEGKVFRYFQIDHVGLDDKDVEKVGFRFAVKKSWMKRHNIAENKIKVVRFNNGRWSQVQSTALIQADERVALYEASHANMSLFAIVGEVDSLVVAADKQEKKSAKSKTESKVEAEPVDIPMSQEQESTNWSWLVYVLVGLIALSVFTAPFYMENPQGDSLDAIGDEVEEITDAVAGIDESAGIPEQVWEQDTVHRIDLSLYFSDPDNEPLAYENTPVEHITVEYAQDIALLTPEAGWSGEGVVVFTATDSDNATVDSNPVRLQVTKAQTEIDTYGTYVLLALVFLVILLIASSLFRKGDQLLE